MRVLFEAIEKKLPIDDLFQGIEFDFVKCLNCNKKGSIIHLIINLIIY
jgi:hypothetical protein